MPHAPAWPAHRRSWGLRVPARRAIATRTRGLKQGRAWRRREAARVSARSSLRPPTLRRFRFRVAVVLRPWDLELGPSFGPWSVLGPWCLVHSSLRAGIRCLSANVALTAPWTKDLGPEDGPRTKHQGPRTKDQGG